MTQKNKVLPINDINISVEKIPINVVTLNNNVSDLEVAKKLCSIYSSAKERNIICTLSIKKLKSLLKTKKCFYTNVFFDEQHIRSIDRVNNNLGYIDSNVVVCCRNFNSLKGNLSLQDIELLYLKTKKFLNGKENNQRKNSSDKRK